MKKVISIITSVIVMMSCMSISFAESDIKDISSEMAKEALLNYLEAQKAENIDDILKFSINEKFPSLTDHRQDIVKYYQLENRKIISSYSIIDQIKEDDNQYKFIIRYYYESGLLIEGPKYTEQINGEWKVVIPADFKKKIFETIDVPESDREAFETFDQRVKETEKLMSNMQSNSVSLFMPEAYQQIYLGSWNYTPISSAGGAANGGYIASGYINEIRVNYRQWTVTSGQSAKIRYSAWDAYSDIIEQVGYIDATNNSSTQSYNLPISLKRNNFTDVIVMIDRMNAVPTNTYGEAYAIYY